ncbi:sugar transferase [Aestuariibius insulae]|uniref:sugar transferase n=1 Tax=Aestuariibius insulae TaxID=2058287 RepID=UPI00345EBCDB
MSFFGHPVRREGRTTLAANRNVEEVLTRPRSSGPFGTPSTQFGKRSMDICFAIMMLVLFAPVLLTICICLYAKGQRHLFYQHKRIGKDGREFGCFKFQTMVADADLRLRELIEGDEELRREWAETRKLKSDPRIIPGIGAFLRSSSLDELPQLFNILRGEMSLVGPRPVTKDELDVYYGVFKRHYLMVKPGLTGPWQLGGRSDTSYDERVQQDTWYVENATLMTDLSIFVRTVTMFLTARLKGSC